MKRHEYFGSCAVLTWNITAGKTGRTVRLPLSRGKDVFVASGVEITGRKDLEED